MLMFSFHPRDCAWENKSNHLTMSSKYTIQHSTHLYTHKTKIYKDAILKKGKKYRYIYYSFHRDFTEVGWCLLSYALQDCTNLRRTHLEAFVLVRITQTFNNFWKLWWFKNFASPCSHTHLAFRNFTACLVQAVIYSIL